jgi:hypothetical protein
MFLVVGLWTIPDTDSMAGVPPWKGDTSWMAMMLRILEHFLLLVTTEEETRILG